MPPTTLNDLTDTPLPLLPPRAPDSHKGNFGRAILIGGSRGMSGAIAMAGKSALRSGAGLATLAVPLAVQDVVASIEPSYMTHPLADTEGHIADSAADAALALTVDATAVALGPGISRSRGTANFVERLYREVMQPMVADADALFALAERLAALNGPRAPRILTPHPGEFERLTGTLPDNEHRTEAAANFAAKCDGDSDADAASSTSGKNETIIVLKGHNTVVTDGRRFSLNRTGNPGMATGGSGDVLTGIITALLCQGLAPFDAARLGVHVHGLAGDMAAEALGQVSMIASDLIEYLPQAFRAIPS
ncbi:MAG TPA: NAD(P)H-hydrate dehydratase [Lacipirellulaceae bacterium]|nr:NAD(P)H-hydrate dehydratase [Lacipirellulaceae bacterium]